MKKLLFCLIAVCGMLFCSCSKDNAKDFEGTYVVNSDVTYSNFGMKAGFSSQESGTITITATGGNTVTVSGMFNTTGHVENGILHLDAEEHVGAEMGAGISFLGYDLAGVSFTTNLHHGDVVLNDNGTMTWNASGDGIATVMVLGLAVNVHANVAYSNTAMRQ